VCHPIDKGPAKERRDLAVNACALEIGCTSTQFAPTAFQVQEDMEIVGEEILHEWDFSLQRPKDVEDTLLARTLGDENGGFGAEGAATTIEYNYRGLIEVELEKEENPMLKGLKSKSRASRKKPNFATKIIAKGLPLPVCGGEESAEEEDGEEEEDSESRDGEEATKLNELAQKGQKQSRRPPAKQKVVKARNSKDSQGKKMKVPVAEKISTAINTHMARNKNS